MYQQCSGRLLQTNVVIPRPAMFDEEVQWNVSSEADKLNESLFGDVHVTTNVKKKKKKGAILDGPVRDGGSVDGNEAVFKKENVNKSKLKRQKGEIKKDLILGKKVRNGKMKNPSMTSECGNLDESISKGIGTKTVDKKHKPRKNGIKIHDSVDPGHSKIDLVTSGKRDKMELPERMSEPDSPEKSKRRRKKKPNSKKNKYKHLALNSGGLSDKVAVSGGRIGEKNAHEITGLELTSSELNSKKKQKQKHSLDKDPFGCGDSLSKKIGAVAPSGAKVKKRKRRKDILNDVERQDSPGKFVRAIPTPSVKDSNEPLVMKFKSKAEKRKLEAEIGSDFHRFKKQKLAFDPEDSVGEPRKYSGMLGSNKVELKRRASQSSSKGTPIGCRFNVDELRKRLSTDGAKPKEGKVLEAENEEVEEKTKQVQKTLNVPKKKSLTLREKMFERLNSARFRDLNEQLYTCTGDAAFSLFKKDPATFHIYHEGYQNQVSKWPVNPVNTMIEYIKSKSPQLVVADFGCGDAKISQSVPNRVHSFDLVAVNEKVTACDMSRVPLQNNTVDIAVFCLSLMGTNLVHYLHEANRVLRKGGVLLIAEVISRIERLNIFIHQVEDLGFMFISKNKPNKMFVKFEFRKANPAPPRSQLDQIELLPCLYKKR